MPDLQPGAFLEQGAPVATIGAGDRVAIFLIRESEIESLRLEVGDPLTLRAENEPATRIHAEVARIDEAGERTLRHEALGAAAGGPVAVDPVSGLAAQPVFEVRARIPEGVELPDGAMVHARFPASPVTLATAAHRSVALFFNKTRASAGTP
jgi:hypothetical protein